MENTLQARAMIISDTLMFWPDLKRMAVKRPTSPCYLLRAPPHISDSLPAMF